MTVVSLAPEVIELIKACRYDCIREKHEGPESWASVIQDVEFMYVDDCFVLLPVDKEEFPFVTVLRMIKSEDHSSLTLFLKDTMYTKVADPVDEMFHAGRFAFCEKFPGQDFYLATVFHEWFLMEPFSH